MLGSVGGRHVSTRRRGSSPQVRGGAGLTLYGAGGPNNSNDAGGMPPDAPIYAARRRRAVNTSDYKSCALVQTRLKFGDITDKDTDTVSPEFFVAAPKVRIDKGNQHYIHGTRFVELFANQLYSSQGFRPLSTTTITTTSTTTTRTTISMPLCYPTIVVSISSFWSVSFRTVLVVYSSNADEYLDRRLTSIRKEAPPTKALHGGFVGYGVGSKHGGSWQARAVALVVRRGVPLKLVEEGVRGGVDTGVVESGSPCAACATKTRSSFLHLQVADIPGHHLPP
ncbi:hypothetical protein M0802_013308 [Mischocyttarus mexicanus]|nr:hypothetical protein M0802_013312 [Mischocyttarus mexicanus]KAI4483521.1 hypothetical protein M0802_013308 [Mischocyttarus mexicanus]